MTIGTTDNSRDKNPLDFINRAFQLVSVSLPYLTGLIHELRITIDRRVQTVGICESGRLIVNDKWLTALSVTDASFVLAHELMHLVLMTHHRTGDDKINAGLYNVAHDFIINDMLRHELKKDIPAGGLNLHNARKKSLEEIVKWLKDNPENRKSNSWGDADNSSAMPNNAISDAMKKAGLTKTSGDDYGLDVITEDAERKLFPGEQLKKQTADKDRFRKLIADANSLKELANRLPDIIRKTNEYGRGYNRGDYESSEKMLRTLYRPPWEMALQQWTDAVSPGPRSYSRPSRRGADRNDVIRPGRKREGWTLHIILDTSGSMTNELPHILGAIASFCENSGVDRIHILQCDVDVTVDEYVDPAALSSYRIAGYGGSDMSPAMHRLAGDQEVEAVIVITDGQIDFPAEVMPYHVLWAITQGYSFSPSYGQVIVMEHNDVEDTAFDDEIFEP